jgi:hypothetical protein
MLKAFRWTLCFWSLFIVTNTIADAIRFYDVFHWYGDLRLWHFLKIWWMLWLFLTGWFGNNLWYGIWLYGFNTGKRYRLKTVGLVAFFILWFIMLRLILHNTLMDIWKTP